VPATPVRKSRRLKGWVMEVSSARCARRWRGRGRKERGWWRVPRLCATPRERRAALSRRAISTATRPLAPF